MPDGNKDGYDFEVGDELSDVRLIVEDKLLHVHKAILGKNIFSLLFFCKIGQ